MGGNLGGTFGWLSMDAVAPSNRLRDEAWTQEQDALKMLRGEIVGGAKISE